MLLSKAGFQTCCLFPFQRVVSSGLSCCDFVSAHEWFLFPLVFAAERRVSTLGFETGRLRMLRSFAASS